MDSARSTGHIAELLQVVSCHLLQKFLVRLIRGPAESRSTRVKCADGAENVTRVPYQVDQVQRNAGVGQQLRITDDLLRVVAGRWHRPTKLLRDRLPHAAKDGRRESLDIDTRRFERNWAAEIRRAEE